MGSHRSVLALSLSARNLVAGTLWCCLFLVGSSADAVQVLRGKVIGVASAETVNFRAKDGQVYTLVLEGVEGPETGDPMAQKSRDYLTSLLVNREARVEIVGRHEGRLVGRIFIELDVSSQMLGAGYGRHRAETTFGNTGLKPVERMAQSQAVGIWGSPQPTAVMRKLEKAQAKPAKKPAVKITQQRRTSLDYLRPYFPAEIWRPFLALEDQDVTGVRQLLSDFDRSDGRLGDYGSLRSLCEVRMGCSMMSVCKEAVVHYEVCGASRAALDPRGTRIPCNRLCGFDPDVPLEEASPPARISAPTLEGEPSATEPPYEP